MIYKYELACREAGLSKEQIAEIRKIFDHDKKRLMRENVYLEKNNILYFSADYVPEENEFGKYAVIDSNVDIEMEVIRKWELKKLKKIIQKLSEEERDFLRLCYEEEKETDMRISQKLGIPRQTLQYRRKKLLMKIKNYFDKQV